jgi:hypothetical protein
MAEREEFQPQWSEKQVEVGMHIWTVYLKNCLFRESVKEGETKPYMLLDAIVEDPPNGQPDPHTGTEFNFRIYLNPRAQSWCLYFLKKFGYPEELLASGKPTIRRNEVAGLHGKVLVNVAPDESGMLRFDVKGFDHLGGDELEKRLAGKPKNGQPEVNEATVEVPDSPVVDLEEDIKQATPNLESQAQDALDDL